MHAWKSEGGAWLRAAAWGTLLLLVVSTRLAALQHEHMDDMHSGHSMAQAATGAQGDAQMASKMAAGKRESERNHRIAGVFVFLAGLLILFQERLERRWPRVNAAWPMCFFITGFLVLVFSDSDIWPLGNKALWDALLGDPEVVQHKIFALILLGLGAVEYERARGRLRAGWAAWLFPLLAAAGAVLLLFHSHGGTHNMGAMERIKMQHNLYAALGAGVAVSKAISDFKVRWQCLFAALWPSFLMILGVSLMAYTE